jgi:hypothetical protein
LDGVPQVLQRRSAARGRRQQAPVCLRPRQDSVPSGGSKVGLRRHSAYPHVPINRIVLQARFLRSPFAPRFDRHPFGSYLGITSLAGVVLPGAVGASALRKLSGYSGLCANRMEPDMSKKEVAVIEWLDIETLKHLLATPLDPKTIKKPRAGRNIRGRPSRNTRSSSATPRRTSHAVK